MSKKKQEKEKPDSKKYTREEHDALTKLYMKPEFQAGFTLTAALQKVSDPNRDTWEADTNGIIKVLIEETDKLRKNDLSAAEDILFSQAKVLDVLFNKYILMTGRSEYMNSLKAYSEIAFKAQRQCRTTLEALAEIKNPRPYIQNNKAQYQQVNNGEQPQPKNELIDQYAQARAHAGKNPKTANGLLEDKRDETEWLDTGAPETAGGNNKELETVGA